MLKLVSFLLWLLAASLTLAGIAAGAERSMPLCFVVLHVLYSLMAAGTAALAISISLYEPKP